MRRGLSVPGIAGLMLLALGGAARADRVDLMSSDGPMRLEISPSGEVDGAYPNRDGVMRGRVTADGNVRGFWTQPRSDHPCQQARGGSHAWGSFEIAGIYTRQPMGFWGYCGERPDRDWKLRR